MLFTMEEKESPEKAVDFIREEDGVAYFQAALETTYSQIISETVDYLKSHTQKGTNKPYKKGVVDILFNSIEVANPNYHTLSDGGKQL